MSKLSLAQPATADPTKDTTTNVETATNPTSHKKCYIAIGVAVLLLVAVVWFKKCH